MIQNEAEVRDQAELRMSAMGDSMAWVIRAISSRHRDPEVF